MAGVLGLTYDLINSISGNSASTVPSSVRGNWFGRTLDPTGTEMGYNTYMANTAYQRASEDMRKAGLNPLLVYGSGGNPGAVNSARASVDGGGNARMMASLAQTALSLAGRLSLNNATLSNTALMNSGRVALENTKLANSKDFYLWRKNL